MGFQLPTSTGEFAGFLVAINRPLSVSLKVGAFAGRDPWLHLLITFFRLIFFQTRYGCWTKNRGGFLPPKSSILIGFSIINHPFWGVLPLFLVQHPYLFSNTSFLLSRTFRVDIYFLRAATTNFQCGSMMINDFGFQYKLEPWKFHGSHQKLRGHGLTTLSLEGQDREHYITLYMCLLGTDSFPWPVLEMTPNWIWTGYGPYPFTSDFLPPIPW